MGGGKRPQRRIRLPDGWFMRLRDICRSKWQQPGTRLDIYELTKIHKRSFDNAKKSGSMTEQLFARLVDNIGYGSEEELLKALSPEDTDLVLDGKEPATPPEPEPIPPEIQALLDEAKEFTDVDKFSEAIPILEDAIAAADASDNTTARVKARVRLGHALYAAREDFTGAEKAFRDALALITAGDNDLKQNALHGLGEMLMFAGRLDEAKAALDASNEAAKQAGKVEDQAGVLVSMGLLERQLGFRESAGDRFGEGLQILLQQELTSGDEKDKKRHAHMRAVCYINNALLCRDDSALHEALSLYEKAERQTRISGEKLNAGMCFLYMGEIHCANADWKDGFECFNKAFNLFLEADNSLWVGRAAENISRLFATHQQWTEAMQAMAMAVQSAAESGHVADQVHFMCQSAKLLREWKASSARQKFTQSMSEHIKALSEDEQAQLAGQLSQAIGSFADEIESRVRDDEQVQARLQEAKDIALRENLPKSLADCLLDEAYNMTAKDDTENRNRLIDEAITHLGEALKAAQSPKRRGMLMGRISSLLQERGRKAESLTWLNRAGEIFEKYGDAYGLANYHSSLAEMHRANGQLDKEVAAYRQVLSIIEGRSFHHLAAGTRINLANALRYKREFTEALKLLEEAELLCEQHQYKDFISAIARNRSKIEGELQIAQAPAFSLDELLSNLGELIVYQPQDALGYLLFWYFSWKTEILSLTRSGPHLSLMVVTDDVDRFRRFAGMFDVTAEYFLLTSSRDFTVSVEPGILALPPHWCFPPNFEFLVMKRDPASADVVDVDADIHFAGPAKMMPLFTWVQHEPDVPGEGHVTALASSLLPQEAIDLMLGTDVDELIRNRTIWLPNDRFRSKDRFLSDLRMGRQYGFLPTYFDRIPRSDAASDIGGTSITIPQSLMNGDLPSIAAKYRRALVSLMKLPRDQALQKMLDLPELFDDVSVEAGSPRLEIRLFDFHELADRRNFWPAMVVRNA